MRAGSQAFQAKPHQSAKHYCSFCERGQMSPPGNSGLNPVNVPWGVSEPPYAVVTCREGGDPGPSVHRPSFWGLNLQGSHCSGFTGGR